MPQSPSAPFLQGKRVLGDAAEPNAGRMGAKWGHQQPASACRGVSKNHRQASPPQAPSQFPHLERLSATPRAAPPRFFPCQAIATRGILSPPQARGGDGGPDPATCVPEGSRPLRSTPLASPVQGHVAILILHGVEESGGHAAGGGDATGSGGQETKTLRAALVKCEPAAGPELPATALGRSMPLKAFGVTSTLAWCPGEGHKVLLPPPGSRPTLLYLLLFHPILVWAPTNPLDVHRALLRTDSSKKGTPARKQLRKCLFLNYLYLLFFFINASI